MEQEVNHPTDGILAALHDVAKEVTQPIEYESWSSRLSVAYIMARRSVSTRFMTEECDNLPSGSYVDEGLIPGPASSDEGPGRFDFYLVSQTYVIGTAKPTLYSVLHNTSNFSKSEIIQLTYRLCAVYMTFAGMVSLPAPLKYAAKLLSLLSKCSDLPSQPSGEVKTWRPNLFFV
ncbi:piwi [Symbiodinium natans]|uniref:Piwi protein n=1 Tax=Symbiodinium natans TaxID=878477 RepID=A0A812JN24_9DINO|nr:piwi [Symbiodinium natans]